jgi:large subunit ribosomal protein L22
MEVIAKAKFIRLSIKKARPVINVIRGKNAMEASVMLKNMNVRAAKEILLVVDAAMANAENNFNLDREHLVISKITVDGGPALKRMRFTGRSHIAPLRKPTSHITVVVSGDVKTKKVAEKTTETKKAVETTEDHKLEVDRPEALKNDNLKGLSNVKAKNNFFRRKTG